MDELTDCLGRSIDEEPVASLCAECKPKTWPFVSQRYLMSRSRGFVVKYGPERVVETIFLNRFGRNGYAQFAGKLPKGIRFGDPSHQVRAALGRPSQSSSPGRGSDGDSGKWDRYDRPDHRAHFGYSTDGRLELVMLMLARAKSRKRT